MDSVVKEIYIYPIKSLAGISVQNAIAMDMGFEFDRCWMLIDEHNQFVSQRSYPILSLFNQELKSNFIYVSFSNSTHTFSVSEYLPIPIYAKIWDDTIPVFEVNKDTSDWFSSQLGFKCKLVKIMNNGDRKRLSSKLNKTLNMSLADSYPYLMIGSKSIELLNNKLDDKITCQRFRPNIYIETKLPHEEDLLGNFTIGAVKFKNIKPCERCIMVNIDQETSVIKSEPLKTLATYRNIENSVKFGTQLYSLNEGLISVGDRLFLES